MKKVFTAIGKVWVKIPPTLQNTVISTIVCVGLTAFGVPVETCEAINSIFAQTAQV